MDPAKQVAGRALSLFEEFKDFAFKGKVVDLAVGVIIGAAFGKIVSSMVENIFMPLISLVLPAEQEYRNWTWAIGEKKVHYGLFLADIFNFLIVALALYIFIVKFLGWLMRTKTESPPTTKDQELLMEIRDLLKAGRNA